MGRHVPLPLPEIEVRPGQFGNDLFSLLSSPFSEGGSDHIPFSLLPTRVLQSACPPSQGTGAIFVLHSFAVTSSSEGRWWHRAGRL